MPSEIRRGQIYEIDWNPGRGSEQIGRRPAVVIQSDVANSVQSYSVTIVLAISTKLKPYPSTVNIEPSTQNGLKATSQVNTGQIMSIDKGRLGRLYGSLSSGDIARIDDKLAYMLGLSD